MCLMKSHSMTLILGGLLGLGIGVTMMGARAQDSKAQKDQKPLSVSQFPDLVSGLRATPGCIGVKTVSVFGEKKLVIMAWFENKKAVRAWYNSKMHVDAMHKFFPGSGGREPLAAFKDENAPIMMIASVTPSDKPMPGQQLAVSQIAIEAYTPVPGGLALGGTFAPSGLKVPGLQMLDKQ